ncbi:V-type ATP synthase subunit I domain-containing protein [Paenibacillus senegalensis]|uniref:hypothetical protein n=1 Tax=Paenibacillus senegalensis TaxID=1465766 RepID=UPI000288DA7C|nr:hypothetical protein [Paenibacillus senegalensis]
MTDQIGSHTEEIETTVDEKKQDIASAMEAFGLEYQTEEETPAETEDEEPETDPPATEGEEPEPKQEPKKVKVKFNKEEVEVDVNDENLPEYVQKALALDKERERKTELEKHLDRAAKLAGFKDHSEFVANIELLEQAQVKKQQDEYEQLQNKLLDELEENGIDRQQAEQYLNNHPLLQQAKQALEEKERLKKEREEIELNQQRQKKWEELFQKYPETAQEVDSEGNAPWFTPDMIDRIQRGYDPVDAYELAHRDKIQAQVKKQAEQQAIKQQKLNKRSLVETQTDGDIEPEVPEELATAFSMFGLSPKLAKKYAKK